MELQSQMKRGLLDSFKVARTGVPARRPGHLNPRIDKDENAGIQKQDEPIGKGEVTANAVNVRNGAGLSYERIGGLTKGKSFQVYEEKDGWLKIQYQTSYGWIAKQYTNYKTPETEQITDNHVTGKVADIPFEKPLSAAQVTSAISYNDKEGSIRRFKLDWVGRLYSVFGLTCPDDHSFTEELIQAIASFQKYKNIVVDGMIGAETRGYLEEAYPILFDELYGSHLEKRTLISKGADTQKRYDYYKSIIEAQGGRFDTTGRPNLLCIRGASKQSDGSVVQAKVNKDNHFNSAATGYDDLMVNLWYKDSQPYVSEYHGSADPHSTYTNGTYGTAHLRDGQYEYQLGSHPSHGNSNIINMANNSSSVNLSGGNYTALVPYSSLEIIRESQGANNLTVSDSEFKTSVEGIYHRVSQMTGKNGINIHTSGDTNATSSTGCQNVRLDEYSKFMSEIYKTSGAICYTLIDASKIRKTI